MYTFTDGLFKDGDTTENFLLVFLKSFEAVTPTLVYFYSETGYKYQSHLDCTCMMTRVLAQHGSWLRALSLAAERPAERDVPCRVPPLLACVLIEVSSSVKNCAWAGKVRRCCPPCFSVQDALFITSHQNSAMLLLVLTTWQNRVRADTHTQRNHSCVCEISV